MGLTDGVTDVEERAGVGRVVFRVFCFGFTILLQGGSRSTAEVRLSFSSIHPDTATD